MRRYLLLGQGDFIQQLMDLLVTELSKDASALYLHNLNGILETAIRSTNAQFEDKDILSRLDVRLLEISPGWFFRLSNQKLVNHNSICSHSRSLLSQGIGSCYLL